MAKNNFKPGEISNSQLRDLIMIDDFETKIIPKLFNLTNLGSAAEKAIDWAWNHFVHKQGEYMGGQKPPITMTQFSQHRLPGTTYDAHDRTSIVQD